MIPILLLSLASLSAQDEPVRLDEMTREERVRHLQSLTWEMEAVRVEGELVIDGKLDEEAWQRAKWITELYQTQTNEGLPASERTEAAVLYDDTNLYIGFKAFDSEPERAQF